MYTAAAVYLCMVVATSGASFVVYGFDKQRAAVGGRRVPERTLHLLAVVGGWPGALAGQRYFRHKTRKVPFLIVFWTLVVLHVAVVAAVAITVAQYLNHGPHANTGWRPVERNDSRIDRQSVLAEYGEGNVRS